MHHVDLDVRAKPVYVCSAGAVHRWSVSLFVGCVFAVGCAVAHADTLFVARRGWHIDVGFSADELAKPLDSLLAGFPGARYLFFGFGDRRYLTAKQRGAPVLLGALWPGPGLLLLTALRASPAAAFGGSQIIEMRVPRDQSLRAQSFVWQALTDGQQLALLAGDREGVAAARVPGPYEGSAFFDSRESYSADHTCNTWVAEVLGSAGLPVRSRGVRFAGQLWNQLQSRGAAAEAPR